MSRKHADILIPLISLSACGLVCVSAPALAPYAVGALAAQGADSIMGDLAADLISKVSDRLRKTPRNSIEAAKNHDLRQLVTVAIGDTLDYFITSQPHTKSIKKQLDTIRSELEERLQKHTKDPRFAEFAEQHVVSNFFKQTVEV